MQKKRSIWADDTFIEQLDSILGKKRETEKGRELSYYGRVVLVDSLINPQKGDILLDMGSGEGDRLKKYENKCSVIGMDISRKMCKEAKKNLLSGEVILANMENLPFKDGVVDKVMTVYSMVYSPHKLGVMKEVSRVLNENGVFVIYEPNKVSLRTLFRYLQRIKFSISGEKNPKAVHHRIVTKQALNYLQYRELGTKAHLKVAYWCGHFSFHIALSAINKNILTDVGCSFLLKVLGYKRWGTVPIVKFFSDFLIIKFVKEH